ncbi:hypothetical protein [Xanthomonas vasicola]|uniref:hypothetical protein n=1 Tax=Xanthomonas vasicola TaxID=56459 RepID=UPI0001CC06ED|nr:hypothetical protein [Xanthomonas vasicola]KFA30800.1 hypothetical protein KWS_0115770 [Xanthomonas vasicola pv. musacearum NCPPB 4384]AZR32080.1 hypothetical protein KWO_017820 [Xanthomonas vasicola pv. musacearum NCPPB 4379]KFA07055.1 hypothetical protein KWQ_0117380 [Xanthomonas vasicola pv. musacearum NCPPB 4380]KFA12635.1 hypothetical protein KWM_0102790 [Xanthomonas vasicola pv. musacearum NCPPB 2005]KFA16378.1 hypothetical protein A11G_0118740 [Xanthomonas vasicola pv. musacearum NCP
MDRKYVTQSVEGYSHALLASAAHSFAERSQDASEEQPNQFALGAMMMCCFALEAYFNQLGHALHERRMLPEVNNIGDFERNAPDQKFLALADALDMVLNAMPHAWIGEAFRFRNKVAHAKPYSRNDEEATWKGARPRTPSTDPPWAKQARPQEASRFVGNMKEVIDRMNEASREKLDKDFPIEIFGSGSSTY